MDFANEKEIIITDEDGTENKYQILFTFEGDDSEIKYVLYYDDSNPEEIFASRYYDDGRLEDVQTDEEWEMIEDVLDTFNNDPDAAKEFGLDVEE